ncbi:MAG TPA: amino acid-binding protein [Candidatus Alistipes faecavium]|uniref:amino acid-binding protein n=1 Tax=uncultured Alistipes sp. TaxID=538949 RepID=UPI001F8D009D|nr:amino acid-binding protein [uncultured Alistipes sp.]HJA96351.1 amino acid-binding protein [Candidatus Alistipes faecavium]
MTVQQISVFVENKSGTLLRVLELFKEARIQLIASTISDTVEYGIYRIICSEPARALGMLRAAGISADVSDVFAIELDNIPGRAADAVRLLSEAGIGISYLYSFLLAGKGILIFRTDDPAKTKRVIRERGLQTLDDSSLLSLL